jgi:hypothetical protein
MELWEWNFCKNFIFICSFVYSSIWRFKLVVPLGQTPYIIPSDPQCSGRILGILETWGKDSCNHCLPNNVKTLLIFFTLLTFDALMQQVLVTKLFWVLTAHPSLTHSPKPLRNKIKANTFYIRMSIEK